MSTVLVRVFEDTGRVEVWWGGIGANDSLLTVIGVKMSIYFGVGREGWGMGQGFDILLLSASKYYFRP